MITIGEDEYLLRLVENDNDRSPYINLFAHDKSYKIRTLAAWEFNLIMPVLNLMVGAQLTPRHVDDGLELTDYKLTKAEFNAILATREIEDDEMSEGNG